MKWLEKFREQDAILESDKSDKTTFQNFRRPNAKTLEAKTGGLPSAKSAKSPAPEEIIARAQEDPDRTWDTETPPDYETEERRAIVEAEIYIPRDLDLSDRERYIVCDLLRRFGGTIEWRKHSS